MNYIDESTRDFRRIAHLISDYWLNACDDKLNRQLEDALRICEKYCIVEPQQPQHPKHPEPHCESVSCTDTEYLIFACENHLERKRERGESLSSSEMLIRRALKSAKGEGQ